MFAAIGAWGQEFPIDLQQGIMAGEVTPTTVILQSRLASSTPYVDPRWEGIPGIAGVARFEVSADAEFGDSQFTAWLEAV
ncbi:MAG: hypothetical protein GY953_48745, partial [bacterium]|nr:hypothetical protein [bacterium]